MPKRPRLLLLDAVAVVAAFEAEVWEGLVAAYDVVVPSVVADEAHFYLKPPRVGRRHPIDLPAMEAAGSIRICEMGLGEIGALLARFDGSFSGRIHAGEAEALAYLASLDEDVDIRLVTSDKAALIAAALLHEAEYHRACIAEGNRMRIQGQGLARGQR